MCLQFNRKMEAGYWFGLQPLHTMQSTSIKNEGVMTGSVNGNANETQLPVKISRTTGKPVGKHGGYRPGAGRKRGSSMKQVQHYTEKYPVLPLDHMLDILNAPVVPEMIKNPAYKGVKHAAKYPEYIPNPDFIPNARRDEMAKAAAPYLHHKLQSVAFTGADGGPIRHSIDITKLSDEELMMFERLVSKAQVLTLDKDEYGEVDPDDEDRH